MGDILQERNIIFLLEEEATPVLNRVRFGRHLDI